MFIHCGWCQNNHTLLLYHQCSTFVLTKPLSLPPLFCWWCCWFPDLDDRMTRSAGRWSPFAALTTSPTATWFLQPHTSRGGERACGGKVARQGRQRRGEEWKKKGGGDGEDENKDQQTKGEGIRGRETIISVSGRWEEYNDQSCMIKGNDWLSALLFTKPFLHQLIKIPHVFLFNAQYIYIYITT